MSTPYNTGKVKIGHGYTYTQRNMPDADGQRLQNALLDKPVGIGTALLGWAFAVACCIGFAFALVHSLSI